MAARPSSTADFTFAFLFLSGQLFISQVVERHDSMPLAMGYFVMFFGYVWLVKYCSFSFARLFLIGLVSRLLLLFSLPVLSDDFYRFIWDGELIRQGLNPYAHLPSEVVNQNLPGMDSRFLEKLNSPDYFTVYPPLNQGIFWLAVSLGGINHLLTSVNVIRIVFIGLETGSFFLLTHLFSSSDGAFRSSNMPFWYFLNPLVILELTGSLHLEVLTVLFVLLSLRAYQKGSILGQGVGMGLAVAGKLVPFIFLPAFVCLQWFKKGVSVCFIAIATAVILFIPLWGSALYNGMGESIGLYFRRFEFNAGVYFLIREIGFWIKGYNMIQTIGPALAAATFAGITSWCIYAAWSKQSPGTTLLFALMIYLLLSTTVHPWYIIPLIPLGLLAGYHFPIAWSFTVFITYLGYRENGFELPGIWIAIEYIPVLLFMGFEMYRQFTRRNGSHPLIF